MSAEGRAVFRVPRQVTRVALEGEYAGAWADLLLNPGAGVVDAFLAVVGKAAALPESERYAAGPALRVFLGAVLVAWNLADGDGTPLPPTAEGLERLPYPLLTALHTAWNTATALPKPSAPPSSNGSAAKPPRSRPGSSPLSILES